MYCVAGLGNPGRKYSATRHNLGFRVAERLAEAGSTSIRRREFSALTATVRIGCSEVLLLKPQTYMNRCGMAVAAACRSLGIPVDRVIAVYDDADLATGRIRIRKGGGTGGHRGIASIIEHVGTVEFVRVRLGIGRPSQGLELADYVLEKVRPEERVALDDLVERAAAAVAGIVTDGVEAAMQKFNAAVATDQRQLKED